MQLQRSFELRELRYATIYSRQRTFVTFFYKGSLSEAHRRSRNLGPYVRVKILFVVEVSNSVPGFSEVHTLKSFVVLWGFGVHDVWPGMLFLTSKLQTVSWHTRRDSSSSACNSARASSTRVGQGPL